MSVNLTINGSTYAYPQRGDEGWGPEATDWAQAVTVGMLQKSGGLFQLLSEVDFGTAFGLKSLYYKSRGANVASAGVLRLSNLETIAWRNAANSGDLLLSSSAADRLTYQTVVIPTISSTDTLTNKSMSGSANTFSNIPYSALILTGTIVNADVSASAAIAYSKLALTGEIVNADINSSAAIAYSKLALTGEIVNADINSSAAIAYSKLNLTGAIVNADLSASAAIAFSKLASLSSGNILVGNGSNVAASVAMSGDVTIDNAGVTAIGANKVTNSQLAQIATATFKGRSTAGTGNVEDLSATTATSLLNVVVGDSGSGGVKGLVPAPAAGDAAADKFLKADGTWTAPSGAGDVVGPASSTANGFAKFADTSGKLLASSAATIAIADGGTGQVTASAAFDALSPMTTAGDLILGGSSGTGTRLGIGANNTYLGVASGNVIWRNISFSHTTGTVGIDRGGTGQTTKGPAFNALSPMTTQGDLIYGDTSGAGTRLAVGTSEQVLGGGTIPSWRTLTYPTVTRYTAGSGTFTVPAGAKWLRVLVVGGGGGGGGSGTAAGSAGSAGGNSTVSLPDTTVVIQANGGSAGSIGASGGAGGTVSTTSPAILVDSSRGAGAGADYLNTANGAIAGGLGGQSLLGGAGPTQYNGSASASYANTGAGGGGAGINNVSGGFAGPGGGAGGAVVAILTTLAATYSYAVGGGGTGEGAGTSGHAGTNGASGVIVFEVHYQ